MLIIGAPDILITDDICRFVREGRFKTVLEDQKRFQVNYVTLREVPTERDLLLELCRFAIASFNYREVRGHHSTDINFIRLSQLGVLISKLSQLGVPISKLPN